MKRPGVVHNVLAFSPEHFFTASSLASAGILGLSLSTVALSRGDSAGLYIREKRQNLETSDGRSRRSLIFREFFKKKDKKKKLMKQELGPLTALLSYVRI
ncbi:hypothetical protein MSSAC_3165 [Methanosarcina siciliae C2J]|uniref:Uncharacterized protein n=1 Tax=Methanosarcina siciliae C2J TaxID=1434118 RepID=A0A0E3PQW6_9EURY|nr:hypothetical protein MSSAC_3165 [Methanosarcina siciliae C2J]